MNYVRKANIINNYVLQFALEPGHDIAWTPWVSIRTVLSRDEVEKFLDQNPVNIRDDNGEEAEDKAIQSWKHKLQVKDPNANVERAHFVFANIIDN